MSFNKTGNIETVDVGKTVTINFWNSFKKTAKVSNKKNVVADFDKSKFTLVHTTIMASVDLEDNGYWITRETEKYINDNGDAWPRKALLRDYHSFRDARVYVEHDQNPERARGRVFDAIARDMGDTVLIDLLLGVDNRHSDLVANIRNGICNATSMGCTTKYTVCTICGNKAHNDSEMCVHIAGRGQKCKDGKKGLGLKNRMVKCSDGIERKCAELCYDSDFFDASIVSNPAFKGAVFRSIVASDKIPLDVASEMLVGKISCKDNRNYCNIRVASENFNFDIEYNKTRKAVNVSVMNNDNTKIVSQKKAYNIGNYCSQFKCSNCNYLCDKWLVKVSNNMQICPSCGSKVKYTSRYAKFFNRMNFDLLDFSKFDAKKIAMIKCVLLDPEKIAKYNIVEKIMKQEGINKRAAKAVLWSDINQLSDSITAEMIVDKVM